MMTQDGGSIMSQKYFSSQTHSSIYVSVFKTDFKGEYLPEYIKVDINSALLTISFYQNKQKNGRLC